MTELGSSFCIICGSNRSFFNRLCQQCYIERHPLVKKKKDLKIVVCNRCDLIFYKGNWSNFYLSDITNIKTTDANLDNSWLASLISKDWSFYYRPKNIRMKTMTIENDYNDLPVIIIGKIEITSSPDAFTPVLEYLEDFIVKIDWGECSDCRTRLSGQYASKIQIRSPKDVDETTLKKWGAEIELLSESYKMSDGKNPLFKLIHLKSGLDALFQTKSPANAVGRLFARNHGGVVTLTTEFAGFDKSRSREYPRKQVILINLLGFDLGEFILLNDQPVQILDYKPGKIEYWDYKKKIVVRIPIKTFLESNPQLITQDIEKYQIVNFEEKEAIAQIMNIKTYETHYINSDELKKLAEGEIFSGILHQGNLLINQKN